MTATRPGAARTHEILNYFGKCPACGYPARATEVRAFGRRGVEMTVTASCELPCGWSGAVPLTMMT